MSSGFLDKEMIQSHLSSRWFAIFPAGKGRHGLHVGPRDHFHGLEAVAAFPSWSRPCGDSSAAVAFSLSSATGETMSSSRSSDENSSSEIGLPFRTLRWPSDRFGPELHQHHEVVVPRVVGDRQIVIE
jgi:hypothetical protein